MNVTARRERVARAVLPTTAVPVRWYEAAGVLVLAAGLEFFRLGSDALAGRPWAEDGKYFLAQALEDGPFRPLSFRYGGYLSVGPRAVSGVVSLFPLRAQGVGMHVATALVQGALALLVYVALRGHLPGRLPRLLIAVCAAAVPVGPEVVGSVANLQWFLIFASLVALFWTPRSRAGWIVICVVTGATVTSSAFGFLVFGTALVRWFLQRSAGTRAVLLVTLVGFAVQSLAMISAPERTGALAQKPGLHPRSQTAGYVRRVLGDGVFGTGRLDLAVHTSVTAGLLVAAVAVLLAVVAGRRRDDRGASPVWFAACLFVLSGATYAVAVVASGSPTDQPYYAARYFVTPALLALTAMIVLAASALTRWRAQQRERRFTVTGWLGAVVAVGLLGSIGFGLVSSYPQAETYERDRGPGWATAVDRMRADCVGRADTAKVRTTVRPGGPGWVVTLRCGDLD